MTAIYPDDTDTSFTGVVDRLLKFAGREQDVVGGVVRTVLEAFAREMSTFYTMLESAHRAGFLDTAEGPALDHVVSILGLSRRRAGRLARKVEFSRSTPALQDIVVPAGRRVTGTLGDKPLPLFETVEEVTILRGQTRVAADVQEVASAAPPGGKPIQRLNPGVLTIMPRPVLGVEAVTNNDPITRDQTDETDDQLRARARTVLRENQRGTLESILAAIREQGIVSVAVREADDLPGVLDVVINADELKDKQFRARVEEAIRAAKPAGIHVRTFEQYTLPFAFSAEIELADPRLSEPARVRLGAELTDIVVQAARGLPPGLTIRKQKLDGLLLAHPDVAAVQASAVSALPAEHTINRPADKRVLLPSRDLYVYPDEAVVLAAHDVKLTWFARPTLAVALVVTKAGTTDATRAAAREVVAQYNAFIRGGGSPGKLFAALAERFAGLGVALKTLSVTRDGLVVSEHEPTQPKTVELEPDEVLHLEDVEVLA
jgi:hypothetical protein